MDINEIQRLNLTECSTNFTTNKKTLIKIPLTRISLSFLTLFKEFQTEIINGLMIIIAVQMEIG